MEEIQAPNLSTRLAANIHIMLTSELAAYRGSRMPARAPAAFTIKSAPIQVNNVAGMRPELEWFPKSSSRSAVKRAAGRGHSLEISREFWRASIGALWQKKSLSPSRFFLSSSQWAGGAKGGPMIALGSGSTKGPCVSRLTVISRMSKRPPGRVGPLTPGWTRVRR